MSASMCVFRLQAIWICLALTRYAARETPELADELELAAFAGRVELCEWPLVEYNNTCTTAPVTLAGRGTTKRELRVLWAFTRTPLQ